MTANQRIQFSYRDLIAFWIFGLANNFGYVVMLSAAHDITSAQSRKEYDDDLTSSSHNSSFCPVKIDRRYCHSISSGAVLLADIVPTLIVKLTFPFFMHRIPFGIRHLIVCLAQAISFLTVALSTSIEMSLLGTVFASFGSGLGEICYLSLTHHYSASTILAWSSGTGGAGLIGAGAYAILTEQHLFGLKPPTVLYAVLIVPTIFLITYWFLLTPSPTIYRISLLKPNTWVVPKHDELYEGKADSRSELEGRSSDSLTVPPATALTFKKKLLLVLPLLKYMVPLGTVYYAEYLINQGIAELMQFDCSHAFGLSLSSQYRWYQVIYQIGVFISRSSVKWIEMTRIALYILPFLQTANVIFAFFQSMYMVTPHIIIVFAFILFEGFFGGAAYTNTFNRIHKEAPPDVREFSLSIASVGDSIGIVGAGFSSLPLHNFICQQPLH